MLILSDTDRFDLALKVVLKPIFNLTILLVLGPHREVVRLTFWETDSLDKRLQDIIKHVQSEA